MHLLNLAQMVLRMLVLLVPIPKSTPLTPPCLNKMPTAGCVVLTYLWFDIFFVLWLFAILCFAFTHARMQIEIGKTKTEAELRAGVKTMDNFATTIIEAKRRVLKVCIGWVWMVKPKNIIFCCCVKF